MVHEARDAGLPPLRTVPLGLDGWRVLDASGRVAGHVKQGSDARGERFIARRFSSHIGGFIDIGAFWSMRDAAAALISLR